MLCGHLVSGCRYAECTYTEYPYAEYPHAKCHYADYRCTEYRLCFVIKSTIILNIVRLILSVILQIVVTMRVIAPQK